MEPAGGHNLTSLAGLALGLTWISTETSLENDTTSATTKNALLLFERTHHALLVPHACLLTSITSASVDLEFE